MGAQTAERPAQEMAGAGGPDRADLLHPVGDQSLHRLRVRLRPRQPASLQPIHRPVRPQIPQQPGMAPAQAATRRQAEQRRTATGSAQREQDVEGVIRDSQAQPLHQTAHRGARTHPGPRGPGSSCRGYGSPAGSRPVSHRPVRRSRRRSRYRPRRGCRRTGRTGSPPRACAPGARRGLSRGPVTLGPVTPGPGCLVRGAWFGQGAPVQLAAGRRREGVQHDHGGRDHVARQWRGEVAAQVGRARFGTAGRDHVRHQPPLPRPVFTDRDRRLGDYLVPGQLRLDLTGFDPEATDLDSLIGPPGELQNLLGGPPHQVPGSGTSAPPARRTGRPRTAWRSGRAG